MLYRFVVVFLAVALQFQVIAGTVVRNGWWEGVNETDQGKFDWGLTVSPGGRVAYYTGKGTVYSIWTTILGPTPLRWIMVAEEGQPPLLSGEKFYTQFERLLCSDTQCFFTTTSGEQQVTVWKATNLLATPSLERILQTGNTTNLGQVRTLEMFVLNSGRLFVYADVGTSGVGLYELVGQKTLVLRVPQALTNTVNWAAQLLSVQGNTFLFYGHERSTNRFGIFRLSLESPAQIQTVLIQTQRIDNGSIISCCLISQSPLGFLIQYAIDVPAGQTTSVLRFLDQDGAFTKLGEARDIRPTATSYINGIGPIFGLSHSSRMVLYKFRELEEGRYSEREFSWDPVEKRSTLIAKSGDAGFDGSLSWGAITADLKAVVRTFSTASSVGRFSVVLFPVVTSLIPRSARPGDTVTVLGTNLYIPGVATGALVGGFPVSPAQTGDGLTFRLPASVPSGQQQVTLELKDATGTISLAAGTVEVANTYPLPVFTSAGVVNAASFQTGPIAPSEIASLFGSNLAQQTLGASTLPLPALLAGTRVLIDGQAAPLFFISPGQINFQVPHTATPGRSILVQVETQADGATLLSQSVSAPVAATAPGCFQAAGKTTVTRDFNLVTMSNPARVGDAVSLWCTGLGPTNPLVAAGEPSPANPPARTTLQVTATLGGIQAEVLFSGLAPGLAGLYQINLIIPDLPVTGVQEIPGRLVVGSSSTNFSVIIARDER